MNQNQPEAIPKIAKPSRRNQRIFGIAVVVLQACVSVMYGFFGHSPMHVLNVSSVITAILMAFLAIAGFGMHFGYLKHLLWSALGLSFLITAITIQVYPLINAFWAKTGLNSLGIFQDSFSNQQVKLFLANMDSASYQNNTITSAIKCSIAVIIALGSVLGRAGPLECLIMTLVGAFGYEKNRTIIMAVGQDVFGTFSIFTFGGFLGLTIGAVFAIREKKSQVKTLDHPMLKGRQQTVTHSLLGSMFIFLLLPLLASQGDQSLQAPLFQRTMGPIVVVLAMASAIVTSMIVGMLIEGQKYRISIKDTTNAILAGGIMSGAASFYATNPFLALLMGFAAAITQYIFSNFLQKWLQAKVGRVSTYSSTLFCLQGLIGAIFSAGYNSRLTSSTSDGFVYPSKMTNAAGQIGAYFISAGLGVGSGLVVGVTCYFLNLYKTEDLFTDKTEFMSRDGIHIPIHKQKQLKPKKVSQKQAKESHGSKKDAVEGQLKDHSDPDGEIVRVDGSLNASQIEIVEITPPSSISEGSFDFADMLQVVIE